MTMLRAWALVMALNNIIILPVGSIFHEHRLGYESWHKFKKVS